MICVLIYFWSFQVKRMRGDVCFHTEDRFYARTSRLLVKFNAAIERAMVSERERAHPIRFRARHQLRDFRKPVKERIVRMDVEVDEHCE